MRAEIDHIQPWAEGGETNAANLQALCARHHHLKDDTSWQVKRHPDGTTRWVSATGLEYAKAADPYPIDRTVQAVPAEDIPPPF